MFFRPRCLIVAPAGRRSTATNDQEQELHKNAMDARDPQDFDGCDHDHAADRIPRPHPWISLPQTAPRLHHSPKPCTASLTPLPATTAPRA